MYKFTHVSHLRHDSTRLRLQIYILHALGHMRIADQSIMPGRQLGEALEIQVGLARTGYIWENNQIRQCTACVSTPPSCRPAADIPLLANQIRTLRLLQMLLKMQIQPQGLPRKGFPRIIAVDGLVQKRNPVSHLLGFLGPFLGRKVVLGVIGGEKVAGDVRQAGCTGLFPFAGYIEEDREAGVCACIVVFDLVDAVDEVHAMELSMPSVLAPLQEALESIPDELEQHGDGGTVLGPWSGVERDAPSLFLEDVHLDSLGDWGIGD